MPFCRSFVGCPLLSSLFLFLCRSVIAAVGQFKLSSAGIEPTEPAGRYGIVAERDRGAGRGLRLKVVALRDDVLRVTYAHGNAFPEDASWAVLPASRQSSVPVSIDTDGDHFGFRTHALVVEVEKKTLKLTVRDPAGNVLEEDARPIRFDGDAFRIYKTMPLDEHYFGLGDKTGPLDRRNEAFTLWNTDAYRFQESTDPIYKSIPYFMTYRAGRAMGICSTTPGAQASTLARSYLTPTPSAVAGPVDYYVFYGPSPKQVVETYAWLTGTPPLPPLWAFGFQQSRYSYMSQARVLEVANRLRADQFPPMPSISTSISRKRIDPLP
jgi:alpha-glucosidase